MTVSEATQKAGDLLRLFPRADASDGFIGAIANVLGGYPRSIVAGVADPLNGYSREHPFLNLSDLIAWLERKTEPMRQYADYLLRVDKQREKWEKQARKPEARQGKLITYGEHLALAAKGLTKERPICATEPGGYLGPENV